MVRENNRDEIEKVARSSLKIIPSGTGGAGRLFDSVEINFVFVKTGDASFLKSGRLVFLVSAEIVLLRFAFRPVSCTVRCAGSGQYEGGSSSYSGSS